MLSVALENGVTYTPGDGFYPGGSAGKNCMRIAFCYESPENLAEAVKRLAAWEGLEKAGESVVEMLARRPSLSAFSTMMTLRQKERPDDEETKLLATLLQRHGRRFTKYQCSNCGFLASSFSWHCLGCGAWDSFPPRRIEDVK